MNEGIKVEIQNRIFVCKIKCFIINFTVFSLNFLIHVHVTLGTVDSEKLKPYRAYIVHFVSLLKVLLSILHLNTIIALFFHF